MVIYVDNREMRSTIPQYLTKLQVPFQTLQLEVGDYIIGEVCISRKTAQDFVSSLFSGHLEQELWEMSVNYPRSIMVVEGFIEEVLINRQVSRRAYISALGKMAIKRAEMGVQGGFSIIPVSTPFDTAWLLKYIHDRVESGETKLNPVPCVVKARRWENPENRQLAIIRAIPYVGEERARKLLNRFGSAKGVFLASKEELTEELGAWGEKIYTVLNEKIKKEEREKEKIG